MFVCIFNQLSSVPLSNRPEKESRRAPPSKTACRFAHLTVLHCHAFSRSPKKIASGCGHLAAQGGQCLCCGFWCVSLMRQPARNALMCSVHSGDTTVIMRPALSGHVCGERRLSLGCRTLVPTNSIVLLFAGGTRP